MKINDINRAANGIQNKTGIDERNGTVNPNKAFMGKVSELSQEKHRNYIKGLIDDISKQGEKIAAKADIKEIQKYRRMITELLNDTAANAFEYVKNDSFGYRGRHRSFALIKKINDKLDEMTKQVLDEQEDKIDIMSAVDDIRGMLVDLFM